MSSDQGFPDAHFTEEELEDWDDALARLNAAHRAEAEARTGPIESLKRAIAEYDAAMVAHRETVARILAALRSRAPR